MKKRVLKYIMGFAMLAGFILAYGTVGAYEMDSISNTQATVQGIIGIGSMLIGAYGLKKTGCKIFY
jgi:hypothetical protein